MYNLARVASRSYAKEKRALNSVALVKSPSQRSDVSQKPAAEVEQFPTLPHRIMKTKLSPRPRLSRSPSDWSLSSQLSFEGDTLEEILRPDPGRQETKLFAGCEEERVQRTCNCDDCIDFRIGSLTSDQASGYRNFVKGEEEKQRIYPKPAVQFKHFKETWKIDANGNHLGEPKMEQVFDMEGESKYCGSLCFPTPIRPLVGSSCPKGGNVAGINDHVIIPQRQPRRASLPPPTSAQMSRMPSGRPRASSAPQLTTPARPSDIKSFPAPAIEATTPRIVDPVYYKLNREWERLIRGVHEFEVV